jgi:hypothetical protein
MHDQTPHLYCKRGFNSNLVKRAHIVKHNEWDSEPSANSRTLLLRTENGLQVHRVDLESGTIMEILQQIIHDRLRDVIPLNDGSLVAITEGDSCCLQFFDMDHKVGRFMVSNVRQSIDLLSTSDASEFQQYYRNRGWTHVMTTSLRTNLPNFLRIDQENRFLAVGNTANTIRFFPLISRENDKLHLDQTNEFAYHSQGVIWDFQFFHDGTKIAAIFTDQSSGLNDIHVLQITSSLITVLQVIKGQHNLHESVFTQIVSIHNTFIATIGSELYLHDAKHNLDLGTTEDVIITAICSSTNKVYFTDETRQLYACPVTNNFGALERLPLTFSSSIDNLLLVHEQADLQMFISSGPFSDITLHEIDSNHYHKLHYLPNIAAAIDFQDKYENESSSDQRQFIIASQGQSDSSKLRTVGKGIGVNSTTLSEQTYEGINGLWTLKNSVGQHIFIVMSFPGGTRILLNGENSIENLNVSAFETNETTIDCECVDKFLYLQVTSSAVLLVQFRDDTDQLGTVVSRWTPPNDTRITTCSINQEHNSIVVGLSNPNLISRIKILNSKLAPDGTPLQVESDISCIKCCNNHIAIGTYDRHVTLYEYTNKWTQITKISLAEHSSDGIGIAESIHLDLEHSYLFIGMREGTCLIAQFDNIQPMIRRLGIYPVRFVPVNGRIIAISNYTWSISYDSLRQQFDFLPIGIDEVLFLRPFSYEDHDNDLLCVTRDYTIDILALNTSQRMNIKSFAIHESCKRVLLLQQQHVAIVISNEKVLLVDLLLQHQDPNHVTEMYQFEQYEVPLSLVQWNDFIVIGTKRSIPFRQRVQDDDNEYGCSTERDHGGVYLFTIREQVQTEKRSFEIKIAHSMDLPGVCYALAVYDKTNLIVSASRRFMICTIENDTFAIVAQNNTRNIRFMILLTL